MCLNMRRTRKDPPQHNGSVVRAKWILENKTKVVFYVIGFCKPCGEIGAALRVDSIALDRRLFVCLCEAMNGGPKMDS